MNNKLDPMLDKIEDIIRSIGSEKWKSTKNIKKLKEDEDEVVRSKIDELMTLFFIEWHKYMISDNNHADDRLSNRTEIGMDLWEDALNIIKAYDPDSGKKLSHYFASSFSYRRKNYDTVIIHGEKNAKYKNDVLGSDKKLKCDDSDESGDYGSENSICYDNRKYGMVQLKSINKQVSEDDDQTVGDLLQDHSAVSPERNIISMESARMIISNMLHIINNIGKIKYSELFATELLTKMDKEAYVEDSICQNCNNEFMSNIVNDFLDTYMEQECRSMQEIYNTNIKNEICYDDIETKKEEKISVIKKENGTWEIRKRVYGYYLMYVKKTGKNMHASEESIRVPRKRFDEKIRELLAMTDESIAMYLAEQKRKDL